MRSVSFALLLSTCLLWASSGFARSQESLRYPYDVIWNAAVRLVRVDMRLAIDEKDADAGFLLFEWVDHDTPYPGSVELVRGGGPREPVHVVVHIGGMPTYVERMILDKLIKKLEREYGAPKDPEPPPPPPKKPPEQPPSEEPPEGEQPESAHD